MGERRFLFLSCLLAADVEELARLNATIRTLKGATAALPTGAEIVILEALADARIAEKLELLEAKRREGIPEAYKGFKGYSQHEIRSTAQRKREAAEARRQERKHRQEARRAQMGVEIREHQQQRSKAPKKRNKAIPAP